MTFVNIVNIGYSESTTRAMQESIAETIRRHDGPSFVMGWEPYVCFKAMKAGCYSHFPYEHMNQEDYYNYGYLWERFNNASLIVFYDDAEYNYKPYAKEISQLPQKDYRRIDFDGYYIYVR